MRPKTIEIIESALYVEDLARSVDFYRDVLGFEAMSGPAGRLCAMGVSTNQVLLLFKKGASAKDTVTPTGTIPGTDGDGMLHVAFGIVKSELHTWEEHLRQSGLSPIRKSWPEGGDSLYFKDPDGHILELKTSNWTGSFLSP